MVRVLKVFIYFKNKRITVDSNNKSISVKYDATYSLMEKR